MTTKGQTTMTDNTMIQLQSILDTANGKRRTRLCDLNDLRQVIAEALSCDPAIGFTSGGHVANAYGYPSSTTVVAAWLRGSTVHVSAKTANANKNAGIITPFGPTTSKPVHLRKWLDTNPTGQVQIPLHAARLFVRRQQLRPIDREALRKLPNVVITLQDSIDAGNCAHDSQRVAGWFVQPSVSSRRLIARVMKREPALLPYAMRAVITAARRERKQA